MARIKASSSCAVAQIRVLVTGVLHSERKSGPWLCSSSRRVGVSFLQQPVQKVPFVSRWFSQVSESGVHRPHVAGIHGRSNDGAYSLVLSGGYEDDVVSRGCFIYFLNVKYT